MDSGAQPLCELECLVERGDCGGGRARRIQDCVPECNIEPQFQSGIRCTRCFHELQRRFQTPPVFVNEGALEPNRGGASRKVCAQQRIAIWGLAPVQCGTYVIESLAVCRWPSAKRPGFA